MGWKDGAEQQHADDDIDTELEVLDHFVTAVPWLTRGPRPGLTLAMATEEALMAWVAEQAALKHASEPFVPRTSRAVRG